MFTYFELLNLSRIVREGFRRTDGECSFLSDMTGNALHCLVYQRHMKEDHGAPRGKQEEIRKRWPSSPEREEPEREQRGKEKNRGRKTIERQERKGKEESSQEGCVSVSAGPVLTSPHFLTCPQTGWRFWAGFRLWVRITSEMKGWNWSFILHQLCLFSQRWKRRHLCLWRRGHKKSKADRHPVSVPPNPYLMTLQTPTSQL